MEYSMFKGSGRIRKMEQQRSKKNSAGVSAAPVVPLASLRLLASPLQLTYAYIWQVIQQRDVRQYSKVEKFVTTLLDTGCQDLLTFKQTAQLLLGLRARIILELLQPEATPDTKTIQTLINKLNFSLTKKDAEVQQCQINFMDLVQTLLKNLAQRKQFFQDVFPVQYGPKFDAALQTMIAGLVCKLEQLLPVPNLTQLGAMISTSMEAYAQFIPDLSDLNTLLKHQAPNAMPRKGVFDLSSNVGDCVLSSLSYRPAVVEPPASAARPPGPDHLYTRTVARENDLSSNVGDCVLSSLSYRPAVVEPPEMVETAPASAASPSSFSDDGDVGEMFIDSDDQVTETPPATPTVLRFPQQRTRSGNDNSTDPVGQNAGTRKASSHWKLRELRVTLQRLKKRGGRAGPEKQGQKVKKKPTPPVDKFTAISSNVEPPKWFEKRFETAAASAASPASFSDDDDVGQMFIDSDSTPTRSSHTRSTDPVGQKNQENTFETNTAATTPGASTSSEKTRDLSGTKECIRIQDRVQTKELQTTTPSGNPLGTPELQKSLLRSIPLKTAHMPIRNVSALPTATSAKTRRVTLQQWVSQIATNSLALPALPPIPPLVLSVKRPRGRPCGVQENVKRQTPAGSEKLRQIVSKKKRKPGVDMFTCETCNRHFRKQSVMLDHIRIHTGEKPYECTECGGTFRTQRCLTNHQKIHSGVLPYTCGHCARGFLSMTLLRRHNLVHLAEKPFYCEICKRGYTQATHFRRHMEAHTSQTRFPCKHCDKTFPTEFTLENHERGHTRDRPHMCERCGKCFMTLSILRVHIGYHIGERQHLCSKCDRAFVYLWDLKRHHKEHDTPMVKIPCPVCGKAFTKYCLKVHMQTHSKEKPHRCPICDKAFRLPGDLTMHKKLHTNERPYTCDICGKTYKSRSHLREHKKLHTCKQPYTCNLCEKAYTSSSSLRKHKLVHSKETTPGFSKKRRHKSKHKKHSPKRKYDDYDDEDY